jgi:hypothetical protein
MSEKGKGSVLSLAEWRQTVQKKTAKECEVIGVYDCEPEAPVYVYAGDVYINFDEKLGYWLILGNNQYSGPLGGLGEMLYEYAVAEGLL